MVLKVVVKREQKVEREKATFARNAINLDTRQRIAGLGRFAAVVRSRGMSGKFALLTQHRLNTSRQQPKQTQVFLALQAQMRKRSWIIYKP